MVLMSSIVKINGLIHFEGTSILRGLSDTSILLYFWVLQLGGISDNSTTGYFNLRRAIWYFNTSECYVRRTIWYFNASEYFNVRRAIWYFNASEYFNVRRAIWYFNTSEYFNVRRAE